MGEWRQQDSSGGGVSHSQGLSSNHLALWLGWPSPVVFLEAWGWRLYASSPTSHWVWAACHWVCDFGWGGSLWLTAVPRWGLSDSCQPQTPHLGDGHVCPEGEVWVAHHSILYAVFLSGMFICLLESYSCKCVIILEVYSFVMCFCFAGGDSPPSNLSL